MKFLIVGLGNPGSQYAETRHNIGFKVLDTLAAVSNAVFAPGRYGDTCTVRHRGHTLVLVKPQTFMNLSGKAVRYWMQQEKVPIENVLVVVDDIALPFGKLRIRAKGSDGGHNGLHDIIWTLEDDNFPRMRFGIGGDFARGFQADYVLGEWTAEEKKELPPLVDNAVKAIQSFVSVGINLTMTTFNKK
ncbi:MAG: aminoacyl-tRNA hydrolase [Rikenellaceae bacterium]|jgi:PTH1 family peptidyl-tRNA hydrolase|nr:aminoacyl-tRNA hydrolase [Rikenellaceae bacterium]